jgi:hypothetical protein
MSYKQDVPAQTLPEKLAFCQVDKVLIFPIKNGIANDGLEL